MIILILLYLLSISSLCTPQTLKHFCYSRIFAVQTISLPLLGQSLWYLVSGILEKHTLEGLNLLCDARFGLFRGIGDDLQYMESKVFKSS